MKPTADTGRMRCASEAAPVTDVQLAVHAAGVARRCMPLMLLVGLTALSGCATPGAGDTGILIETETRGQALAGAACVAIIGDMRWDFVTPAVISVGQNRGDLRIVCNKTGYRTSELLFKPAGGYGSGFSAGFGAGSYGSGVGLGFGIPLGGSSAAYPKRLVLEMNQP